MSKKERPKPTRVGDNEWVLNGKTLDCHSCKYYAEQSEIETDDYYCKGYDYCSYHRFKFKLDSEPRSDYSTCEHFTYDESKAPAELGVGGVIILSLIIAFILCFFCDLGVAATIVLTLMIGFKIWISSC